MILVGMYGNDGRYYNPTVIDVTNIQNGMIPMEAEAKYMTRNADGTMRYDAQTEQAIQDTIDRIDAMVAKDGKNGLQMVEEGGRDDEQYSMRDEGAFPGVNINDDEQAFFKYGSDADVRNYLNRLNARIVYDNTKTSPQSGSRRQSPSHLNGEVDSSVSRSSLADNGESGGIQKSDRDDLDGMQLSDRDDEDRVENLREFIGRITEDQVVGEDNKAALNKYQRVLKEITDKTMQLQTLGNTGKPEKMCMKGYDKTGSQVPLITGWV